MLGLRQLASIVATPLAYYCPPPLLRYRKPVTCPSPLLQHTRRGSLLSYRNMLKRLNTLINTGVGRWFELGGRQQ